MGIYISNLEMPKRGMVVNIYADGRVTNHFDEFGKTIGKAVPVPPHGDLIDRDELKKSRIHYYEPISIEEAPVIIPASEEGM